MINEKLTDRMKEIIFLLDKANKAYYTGIEEIMADREYDRLYSELVDLEKQAGIKMPGSPTVTVGYKEPDEEGKIEHYTPILSLKATKSIDELLYFLGEHEGVLSWKLDGISIVLYYMDGRLYQAITRGDGLIGRDILNNVKQMKNVPLEIPDKGHLIVRGEGCLALSDFDNIKKTKEGEKFKNPRNLAAGLIGSTKTSPILLNYMSFIVHTPILLDSKARRLKLRSDQLSYLETCGFKVVPHFIVANFELRHHIDACTDDIQHFEFPVDGLVLAMNDISYGESLGATSKYPKHSLAFKWPDETVFTTIIGMKWSVSRTGLITPVVLLEPVWLEGTEVRQANLHSLKIFEKLGVGIGDQVKVYKANKIIPEIEENYTRSQTELYPKICPVCGADTTVVETDKTRKLYCTRNVPWVCTGGKDNG